MPDSIRLTVIHSRILSYFSFFMHYSYLEIVFVNVHSHKYTPTYVIVCFRLTSLVHIWLAVLLQMLGGTTYRYCKWLVLCIKAIAASSDTRTRTSNLIFNLEEQHAQPNLLVLMQCLCALQFKGVKSG
jgi:hypothetical protein